MAISGCFAAHYNRIRKRAPLREAIRHAKTAVALSPNNSNAHRFLGDYLAVAGYKKRALPHLSEAIRLSPSLPANYAILGKYYQQKGRAKKARQYFDKALELDPENTEVLALCARNYFFKGDVLNAERYARELLRLKPGHPDALVVMGTILLKERKNDEAAEHARIVIGQHPNDYKALTLIALIETRKNPLRGGSFRLALWFRRRRNRYIALICSLVAIPVFAYLHIGMPALLPLFLLLIYLRISTLMFKRYVTRHYLSEVKIQKSF